MQQLALEQRRLLGPRAPWHVGDVAWGLRQHEGREPEWTFRLWRDSGERVAIHRDVWEPSRVTESSYRNVMAEWPYRRSLDCVVEAPDGRFASYVLVWPDDENGVGLFEPVGTRAEFRRRGLGAAVCTFGLQRLHEEGMRRAVVGCDTDPACALYEALGFRRCMTIVAYAR